MSKTRSKYPSLIPDGRGAALLFTNLQAEVGGTASGPTVRTRLCSVRLPTRDHAADRSVRQHLRGHASVSAGARAVLFAQLAGETFVRTLDAASAGEIVLEVTSTLRAGSDYVATLLLVAECDAAVVEQSALIVLDSIDVVLEDTAAACPG